MKINERVSKKSVLLLLNKEFRMFQSRLKSIKPRIKSLNVDYLNGFNLTGTKKNFINKEKNNEIERSNRLLLEKLSGIFKKRSFSSNLIRNIKD